MLCDLNHGRPRRSVQNNVAVIGHDSHTAIIGVPTQESDMNTIMRSVEDWLTICAVIWPNPYFHPEERSMFARSCTLAVATISIAAVAVLSPTNAFALRGAFDGNWSVEIVTSRGACPSGVGFAVDVRDGVVSAAGLLNVSGNVTANGETRVRIASGNQSASGTGRLIGNSGSGTWQGAGSQGICAGRWSASRR
jgi:hypothetical protein